MKTLLLVPLDVLALLRWEEETEVSAAAAAAPARRGCGGGRDILLPRRAARCVTPDAPGTPILCGHLHS
jgi:hypothetical protein